LSDFTLPNLTLQRTGARVARPRPLSAAFGAQSAAALAAVESFPEGHPMARDFSVVIERDAEGYYVASVPALRGCHTQATSLDELMTRVREAVELCLEVEGVDVEPLDFIGVQKITVA